MEISVSYSKLFVDVDECSVSNGGCSQICTNTMGSFFCECEVGYELVNETECGGELNDQVYSWASGKEYY